MTTTFITASRDGLLDNIAAKYLLDVKPIKTNNLEGFAQEHAQSLSHVRFLFIDLAGLFDNNDEIVATLNNLKILHPDMRIIVLADHEDKRDDKDLLRRIYTKGVYNIVTTASEDEISHCIVTGKTEEEARETFAPTAKTNHQPEEVFNPSDARRTVQRLFMPKWSDKASKQAMYDEANLSHEAFGTPKTSGASKASGASNAINTPQAPKEKEILRANKEFRKFKDFVSIGIIGTQPHIGTTHNALQITRFLKDIGFRAAYVEANSSGDIKTIMDFYPSTNRNDRKCLIQHNGINLFYTGFEMPKVMAEKCDFYVFDLGVLDDSSINQFLMRDIRIVIGGSKPWEVVYVKEVMKALGKQNSIHYLLNFAQIGDEVNIQNYLGFDKSRVSFTELSADPFKSDVNLSIYKRVFKEYIL